jgi:hypothetical protein
MQRRLHRELGWRAALEAAAIVDVLAFRVFRSTTMSMSAGPLSAK